MFSRCSAGFVCVNIGKVCVGKAESGWCGYIKNKYIE